MTAGVVPTRPIARCGVCDSPRGVVRCERCDEPTCMEHLRRVERAGASSAPSYECVVCAVAEPLPVALVSAPQFEVPA